MLRPVVEGQRFSCHIFVNKRNLINVSSHDVFLGLLIKMAHRPWGYPAEKITTEWRRCILCFGLQHEKMKDVNHIYIHTEYV